jgi:Fe2+ transport system protein B
MENRANIAKKFALSSTRLKFIYVHNNHNPYLNGFVIQSNKKYKRFLLPAIKTIITLEIILIHSLLGYGKFGDKRLVPWPGTFR